MKKYFLVGFLFLQVGFLYAQKASEKPPFKKWEYGLQSNIVFTNRIYVERYLKKNLSIKTSLANEMLPFSRVYVFAACESELRYYEKIKHKMQRYVSIGISLRTNYLWAKNFSDKDPPHPNAVDILNKGGFWYIPPFSKYNTIFSFQAGLGCKKQFTKHIHFEIGADLYFLTRKYDVYSHDLLPTFTVRFGINWNKN